ncbi:hypothetical protein TNCV_4124381 [Trichonephila clavipes]|nr:hypothetical protein TNCV_4124381 [Trichonephila clavipes]
MTENWVSNVEGNEKYFCPDAAVRQSGAPTAFLKIGCITAGNDSASVRQGKAYHKPQVLGGTKCLKKAKKGVEDEPVTSRTAENEQACVFFGHGPAFQRSYDHRTATTQGLLATDHVILNHGQVPPRDPGGCVKRACMHALKDVLVGDFQEKYEAWKPGMQKFVHAQGAYFEDY